MTNGGSKMISRRINTTKLDIIQIGTKMFLEKGYSRTNTRELCDALDISPGNLTFHFPTKEHLLSVLVDMLCGFQSQTMERLVDEGKSSLMAFCLELMTMAAACEESESIRDFYVAAYTHPMTLEMIRKNDALRAKQIFGEFCQDWSDERFLEAETLISGIEYGTLMTTESSASLEFRIAGALNGIMLIFGVPEDTRRMKIQKVLSMDYRAIGHQLIEDFIKYVDDTTEQAFEALIEERKRRRAAYKARHKQ